jgi:DNA-binding MarR family transcriptional regulator
MATTRARTADRRPLDADEMAAWRAFVLANARIVKLLQAEMEAEQGLSLPAYEALARLSEACDGRMRMSDLATFATLTPSGLTRLVDKLVADGLVERLRCDTDARVVYAAITPAGRQRLRQAYPTHLRGVREHFVDRLTAGQLVALHAALDPLVAGCPTGA